MRISKVYTRTGDAGRLLGLHSGALVFLVPVRGPSPTSGTSSSGAV